MSKLLARAVVLVGMTLSPTVAAAQEVSGVVVDASTRTPVAGAAVTLEAVERAAVRQTETDEQGRFALEAREPGTFVLRVSRLGYHELQTEPVELGTSERLVVTIRLGVDAVPLEPLIVTDRSRRHPPDIIAFYDRMRSGQRSGAGHFISRADMEGSFPARTTDLLRSVRGVQVVQRRSGRDTLVRMRGGCIPSIYVDGAYLNRVDTGLSIDHYVSPRSIEGIEVYRGTGRSVGNLHDPRGCGLILVWTQRGERSSGGEPIRWKRVGAVVGVVLGLFFLLQ